MTTTLDATCRILAHLVLHRGTVRVVATVPDGPPKIAVQPAGVLTDDLRELLALPLVRRELARHMQHGSIRFTQGAIDVHSVAGTAAGFAHLQLCLLTNEARELFEERASVREYEAGMSRPQAELFALFDVLDHASVIESIATLAVAA